MAGLVLILAAITFWAGSSQAQNKILKISEKSKKIAVSKVNDKVAVADAKCAYLSELQVGQEVMILAAADAINLDDDWILG